MDFNTVVELFRREVIQIFPCGDHTYRCEQFLEGLIKKTYNLEVCVYISLVSNFIHVYVPGPNKDVEASYRFGIDFESEDQFLANVMKDFLFS
jgi:hypothetical protein